MNRILRNSVLVFLCCTTMTHTGTAKEIKKKYSEGYKRAVDNYSYPVSTVKYTDKTGTPKGKVIVETIKSISPSDYLTSTAYIGSTFEPSTPIGKIPVGSVTFNAFEADTTKKETATTPTTTETTLYSKKKYSYRHYTSESSSTQKSTVSAAQISSTISPAPVRTTSVEPDTALPTNYQFVSRSSSLSGDSSTNAEKPLKIISTTGGKNGRFIVQRLIKKATEVEPKHSDSKPEETGFNGYHYDVGSLSFESKHSGGGQGGMMGASYMRSSSPFYNYHVMLD